MKENYDLNLIKVLNAQAYNLKFGDLDVRVKPVDDAKHEGMIDPRLYPEVKNLGWLRFIPKRFLKIELKPKTLEMLRKGFDSVDSAEMVEESLDIKTLHIRRDDTDLRMRIYRRDDSIENAPVLYFIHGGGFFAGRTEVIEEALKLLVSRFDVVAFSLDYRLAPEHPYPVGHEDTYFGFKWVLDHASEYGYRIMHLSMGVIPKIYLLVETVQVVTLPNTVRIKHWRKVLRPFLDKFYCIQLLIWVK